MGCSKWLLAALFVTATACGDDGIGDPTTDSGPVVINDDAGVATAECEVDDDCPFGQVCTDGECSLSDANPTDMGCWTDDDCGSGQVCAMATGRCVPEASVDAPPMTETSTCTTGQTRDCGTKVGACAYGVERCIDGNWTGQCEGGTRPDTEICNGLDDDCNGIVDDGFVLGAACSAGRGVCEQTGTIVCSPDGSSTECSVEGLDPTGLVELCGDGLDNDCNGQEDEGFALNVPCTAGSGACQRSGVTTCSSDGTSAVCSAVPGTPAANELCGGAPDDNCNGQEDEGFEDFGNICIAGTGACLRTGTLVCTTDQLGLRCSATAGTPGAAELCGNNVDENCDGNVNEGFEQIGQACTVGTPPCQSTGTWVCGSSGTALECQLPPAQNEVCNGADDDNDSCTDEGFDVGAACTVGTGICARSGFKVCTADGSGTECDVTPGPPDPNGELCGNNLDDDCNGQTDEGFPTVGNACSAGLGICERSGSLVCSGNGLSVVCDAVAGQPNPDGELCGNGLNDDCDPQTDEGFGTGIPCNVGQGICQRSGQTVCSADGLSVECSAAPGQPNPDGELCGNGLNDDCDNQTDEGFPVGDACTVGQGICENSGTLVCTTDMLGTECDVTPGNPNPNGELCDNNQDDDCNGVVDDGFPNLGQPCTVGVGECEDTGTFVCTANLLGTECNATAGTPTIPEVCDGLDDDCNSVIDNGCDDDVDGWCDENRTVVGSPAVCSAGTGDCQDTNGAINPGAAEVCFNTVDEDCDGTLDNGCANCDPNIDADFDGDDQCTDCDDTNGAVYNGAPELCDGLDNDCNGIPDDGFDNDNDGYATCDPDPAVFDCDDTNPLVNPGSCERCLDGGGNTVCAPGSANNGIDDNCNGYTDESCAPCDPNDTDGDGVAECDGDCAPGDGNRYPGAPELCDGVDNDCNTFTVENCEVGDTCNWAGGADVCAEGLLCVESLTNGGNGTGNFTCTSFCNYSEVGLGLGDGCQSNQICSAFLTPTANLHGCAVATDIGPGAVGSSCGNDDECRSGNCYRDQRQAGPPVRYCSDLCGSDAYCGNGTVCQGWASDTGRCLRVLSAQTISFGQDCSGSSALCENGNRACVTAGGSTFCSQLCCTDSDCPGGYHCSPQGNSSPGPSGGVDTVPVCWPDVGGQGTRLAGAACTTSSQCQSNFCDVDSAVCLDICCNDSNCPTGLSCEQTLVTRFDGNQTFARMCVNQSFADDVEAR